MGRFHIRLHFLWQIYLVVAILFSENLWSQEMTVQMVPAEKTTLGVVTVQEAGLEFRYEIYPTRLLIGDSIFVRCQVTNQTGKDWEGFPIVPDLGRASRAFRAMYQIIGDDSSGEKSRMFCRSGPMFMLARELRAEERGRLMAGETKTWWECQHQTSFVFLDEPNLPRIGNNGRHLPKESLGYDHFRSWLNHYPEENLFRLRCPLEPAIRISDTVKARSDVYTTVVIDLRPDEELQAVEKWVNQYGINRYGAYQSVHKLHTTLDELLEFEQQLSPGTFRDEIHKEIFMKRLLTSENSELFVQISNEMLAWLETLPELQRRGLAREIVPCIEALKKRDQSKFTHEQKFVFTDEYAENMEKRIQCILK